MKKSLNLLLMFIAGPLLLWGQKPEPISQSGRFGLGLRGTYNFFPGKDTFRGFGTGGQFKIGAGKKVNTEFFLDYISSNDKRNATRNDYHFGWSVQFSPFGNFGEGKFRPYFLGGQCFDFTKVAIQPVQGMAGYFAPQETPVIFSAAIQAGAGVSTFVQRDVELTLQLQYMIHLGNDVHVDYSPMVIDGTPVLVNEKRTDPAGHLIASFSVNYYFLRLWKR